MPEVFQSPQVVTNFYDFLKYSLPFLADFPKNQRYTLGQKIEELAFDTQGLLVAANFNPQGKLENLQQANVHLQEIRLLTRLSKDLNLVTLARYEQMSKKLHEIGKQVGGWIKLLQKKKS